MQFPALLASNGLCSSAIPQMRNRASRTLHSGHPAYETTLQADRSRGSLSESLVKYSDLEICCNLEGVVDGVDELLHEAIDRVFLTCANFGMGRADACFGD